MMKQLIASTVLATATTFAVADDTLVVNLRSNHVGSVEQYNENNFGVGYGWDTNVRYLGDIQGQVGVFRNSKDRTSLYIAGEKTLWSSGRLSAGYVVGGAIGYPDVPIMPIVGGVISYRVINDISVTMLITGYSDDGDDNKLKPLVGFQLKIPF